MPANHVAKPAAREGQAFSLSPAPVLAISFNLLGGEGRGEGTTQSRVSPQSRSFRAATSSLACLFLLLLTPGLQAQDKEKDRVVGSIGDLELRESEVLDSLRRLDGVEREALAQDRETLNKLVRSLLVQRVVLQQALADKWDAEPSIQPLLKNTREAAITDSYLKSLCQPPESYPSESELQDAYDKSRASLTVPRSFRLAQIFIGDGKGADKKLEEVRRFLKTAPGSFGKLARETSEEKDSASRDGEIGWLNEKQIQPEILAQLPKLAVNVISEPVRLKDGWHILKVLDVREAFTPLFPQVRLQLAQRLRAERTRASMQAYMAKTLQNHPVAINEVVLSKLLLVNP